MGVMEPSQAWADPVRPFLDRQGFMVLDGGLATELEGRGCVLDDRLWSARLLIDQPGLIREVHLDYLHAGADCIISASYQATIEGFKTSGLDEDDARELLRRSVDLAQEARDVFWAATENQQDRIRPLVAASVGPYGAYLADGSEFRGDYDLSEDQLVEFHQNRWQVLAGAGADLLACETLPALSESRALRRLLEATPGQPAWFSFSCRDSTHLSDGSPRAEAVLELDDCKQIVAIGINCTAPHHIAGLVQIVRCVTSKPIVVYPNSGEGWDTASKSWIPADEEAPSLSSSCRAWHDLGAQLIGGCCRTGPQDIRQVRRALFE